MKKISLLLTCLGFGLSPFVCAKESAEFNLYLFEHGLPKANIALQIDNQYVAKTDSDGHIGGQVSPGIHRFNFIQPQINRDKWSFKHDFMAQEQVQFIISFPAHSGEKPSIENGWITKHSESQPSIEIESSNKQKRSRLANESIKASPTLFGTVSGIVRSAETQKPIANAQIYISGLVKQIKTNAKGEFRLEKVPVGQYSLSVLHPAFNSKVLENIKISKNKQTTLSLDITPVGVDLPEYVVLEPFLSGSIASVIEEQKSNAGVSNVLGSEQIQRNGDSTVASALKRVSGLTLVEGKYVFILGLGERYTTILVNGSIVPSPDPTRRVVPLDLFPTSILDSLLVSKAYLPSLPGEFAGGTIELRTRGVPEDFFFNFSGKIGGTEGTTFAKGLAYHGGSTDYLGMDDGTRALPNSLEQASAVGTVTPQSRFNPDGYTNAQTEKFGEDLSQHWDVSPTRIGPDGRIQISMGDLFTIGDFSFGYLGAARWNQTYNIQNEIRREYATSENNALVNIKDFRVDRTLREVDLNGYLALEARYQDNHKIFTKFMAIRQSIDEARIGQGFTDAESYDIRRTLLKWKENQLFNSQLGGEHLFPELNELEFKWLYTNSEARRDAPNERHYRYDSDSSGQYSFSTKADNNQVNFSTLIDKSETWRYDIKLPITIYQDVDMALQTGFMNIDRTRNSQIRRYNFTSFGPDSGNPTVLAQTSLEDVLSPTYIGTNGFQLRESTRVTDSYQARQNILAFYGQVDLTFFDTLKLNGGMRWERNNQVVETVQLFSDNTNTPKSELKKSDLLPAITGTWVISDKQQLRASWSKTISRPDFRELSPAPFTDPVSNAETKGNPNLIQTSISNYDARWEYYFSPKENFSAGFFWKDLQNPIEKVFTPGTGGLLSFQNSEAATVYGIELEVLKNLDFIHPALEYFYAGSNYTWSKSKVTLTPENLLAQTSSSRPLQGQSPHVFNAQLGYDNPDMGTQVTLLYNIAAARIIQAGVLGAPDFYQQPFNQLDFVYRQRFTDWMSINFRMKNLLDDTSIVKQGDKITRMYTKGRSYSLTLAVNF